MKNFIIAATALIASAVASADSMIVTDSLKDTNYEVITLADGTQAVVDWNAYFSDNCPALMKDAETVQRQNNIDAMNMVEAEMLQ